MDEWRDPAREAALRLWITTSPNVVSVRRDRLSILTAAATGRPLFWHEAHVPAERPSAQAPARLPGPDGDPGRSRHPEAAESEGPQAALGLAVKRRNRLSRSRDFETVYRRGRSVSTRFLVLYSFPREEDDASGDPRFGLAVSRKVGGAVERNRLKRRLRAVLTELGDAVPAGRDYVLVVRPGLSEAVEARGHRWLAERVHEVFALASGAERTARA